MDESSTPLIIFKQVNLFWVDCIDDVCSSKLSLWGLPHFDKCVFNIDGMAHVNFKAAPWLKKLALIVSTFPV
jgi:hypothetical protein